jgi:tetratricopeptide (TPR) repeat protein
LSDITQQAQEAWAKLNSGQYSLAETLFITAFEATPTELSLLNGLGQSMMGRRGWSEALEIFYMLIEQEFQHSKIWAQIAECYYHLNNSEAWLSAAHKSMENSSPTVEDLVTYAQRLAQMSLDNEALRALNRALRINDRSVVLHQAFANLYLKQGDRQRAIQSLSAVAALDPNHGTAIKVLGDLLNHKVPTWHFPMMNDDPRNQAFEEAIMARIEPGDIVLDIGCGAGLLSLMAIRAGAERVIAVEGESAVAEAAEKIFKTNGVAEQIQLIEGRSTSLKMGVDISEKADLLVSEVFDVSLLGEDALYTFKHAQEKLLKEGAKMIPAQARVWCALVESDELRARFHVEESCGFDLSEFNQLRDPRVLQLDLGRFNYQMLTEPTLATSFDFEKPIDMMGQSVNMAEITQSGRGDGFIFWYDLVLAPATADREEIILSTAPNQKNTHWLQGFAPCYGEQRAMETGQMAQILCGYRRFLLWLQLL